MDPDRRSQTTLASSAVPFPALRTSCHLQVLREPPGSFPLPVDTPEFASGSRCSSGMRGVHVGFRWGRWTWSRVAACWLAGSLFADHGSVLASTKALRRIGGGRDLASSIASKGSKALVRLDANPNDTFEGRDERHP